jgi:hypothetical protein
MMLAREAISSNTELDYLAYLSICQNSQRTTENNKAVNHPREINSSSILLISFPFTITQISIHSQYVAAL